MSSVDGIKERLNAPVALHEIDEHLGALVRQHKRLSDSFDDLLEYAESLEADVAKLVGDLAKVTAAPPANPDEGN